MSKLVGYVKKNLNQIIKDAPPNIDIVINKISKYHKFFSWYMTSMNTQERFRKYDTVIIEGSKPFVLELLHMSYSSLCRKSIIVLTDAEDFSDFTMFGDNITVMRSIFIPNTSILKQVQEYYPNSVSIRESDTELMKNYLMEIGFFKDITEQYDYIVSNRRDCAEAEYLAIQTKAKKIFPKWDIFTMFGSDIYHTEYYNTLKKKDFQTLDNLNIEQMYPRSLRHCSEIITPESFDAINIAIEFSQSHPNKKILVYVDEAVRFHSKK